MKEVKGKSNFSIYKGGKLVHTVAIENTEKNQSDFLALFIIENRLPIEQDSNLPKLDLYQKTLREAGFTFNTF